MASEIFWKLPGIEGETTTSGFENQIQLLSFSWGVSQPTSMVYGTGGGAGKADWQHVSFSKQIDKSSPKLMEACVTGKHIQDAKITVREAGGEEPVEYYTLEFKDVMITSYQTAGHEGGEKMDDTGSFSYSEAKKTYHSQDEKGQKKDKVEFGWSLKQNKAI